MYNKWSEYVINGLNVYEMDWMYNNLTEFIINGQNV